MRSDNDMGDSVAHVRHGATNRQPSCGVSKLDLDHILSHTSAIWEPLRGRSVFITGGTGFVGTWLSESFIWANEHLGLDARAVLLAPRRGRLITAGVFNHPSVQVIEADLCTFKFPHGSFPFVIHAGVHRPVAPSPDMPVAAFASDVEGTRRVLEFARTHGTERFLFTSSGAIYGPQPTELSHISEEYSAAPSTIDVGSAYAQSKRVSEWLCAMYAHHYGFAALIARMFTFVGPLVRLDRQFAVGNFIRDVIAGGPVRVEGDGTPFRSYLYAADLTIWLWHILMRGESAFPINVGSAEALSIGDLARLVVNVTVPGTKIEFARQPVSGAPAPRYVPEVERARRELGLEQWVSVEEGIRRMYQWAGTLRSNVTATSGSVQGQSS